MTTEKTPPKDPSLLNDEFYQDLFEISGGNIELFKKRTDEFIAQVNSRE